MIDGGLTTTRIMCALCSGSDITSRLMEDLKDSYICKADTFVGSCKAYIAPVNNMSVTAHTCRNRCAIYTPFDVEIASNYRIRHNAFGYLDYIKRTSGV